MKGVVRDREDATMRPAVEAVSEVTPYSRALVSSNEDKHSKRRTVDPMRRFVSTPYSARLPVMGRTVRLETNSPKLLKHMIDLFAAYPGAPTGGSDFFWRIVVESDKRGSLPWPRRSAFSDDGLRFVEFGQRNFLAVDLEVREAIGILSEALVEDGLGLTSPFLDNLFCLTVGALGLVPLWANCVARENRGVLLLGGSNNGKTTASYVAEKLGLDFHADEGAFLEVDSGVLRSWGGFWPATFRPETLQFLPELTDRTRPCIHQDFVVYHLAKQGAPKGRRSIQPLCCLFLERQSSTESGLSRITRDDLARLLAESILFKDDSRFREQEATVLHALEGLPAYVFHYGSDPAVAAVMARDLLAAQDCADPGRELLARPSGRGRRESPCGQH